MSTILIRVDRNKVSPNLLRLYRMLVESSPPHLRILNRTLVYSACPQHPTLITSILHYPSRPSDGDRTYSNRYRVMAIVYEFDQRQPVVDEDWIRSLVPDFPCPSAEFKRVIFPPRSSPILFFNRSCHFGSGNYPPHSVVYGRIDAVVDTPCVIRKHVSDISLSRHRADRRRLIAPGGVNHYRLSTRTTTVCAVPTSKHTHI